jgi:hypothetical protein
MKDNRLRECYSTVLGEEEMLGDLKGGGGINTGTQNKP